MRQGSSLFQFAAATSTSEGVTHMFVRRWFHSCSVRWSRLPRRLTIPAVLGALLVFGALVFLPWRAGTIVKPAVYLTQVPELELPLNFFSGPMLPSIDDLAKATATSP